jgi:hypothetical protein
MNADLAVYLTPAAGTAVSFAGRYPEDFPVRPAPQEVVAWHLVGGKDLLEEAERTGSEPDDGYPVLLRDWIRRDGLPCLKVKLRGDDGAWDYAHLSAVGKIATDDGCRWLSAHFNCTVNDPLYVTDPRDRLLVEQPSLYAMLLYVEQPFDQLLVRTALRIAHIPRPQRHGCPCAVPAGHRHYLPPRRGIVLMERCR